MSLKTLSPSPQNLNKGKNSAVAQGNTSSEPAFNLVEYLKGVKQEWHKITWPTRIGVTRDTIVVLIVVTLFSLFIFVVDKLFQLLINWIT